MRRAACGSRETPEYPNGRRVPNTDAVEGHRLARTAASRPRSGGHDLHPLRHQRRRRHGQEARLRRQARTRHRVRASTRTASSPATSPDIWYLEDTNGDEVADKRTKLYTGLGTYDTHAVINNLRWGLDGWIYATHGYSVGDVTSLDGTKTFGRDGSGVVRFKPDGSAFEQYQQPRRQHLGPRHHLGRSGVLDAADERHGLLPYRPARVRARQGHDAAARRRGKA